MASAKIDRLAGWRDGLGKALERDQGGHTEVEDADQLDGPGRTPGADDRLGLQQGRDLVGPAAGASVERGQLEQAVADQPMTGRQHGLAGGNAGLQRVLGTRQVAALFVDIGQVLLEDGCAQPGLDRAAGSRAGPQGAGNQRLRRIEPSGAD